MSTYDSSGVLSLGANTATAVNISRTGRATTFASGSTVTFTGANVVGLTLNGATFSGPVTAQQGITVSGGGFTVATGQAVALNGTTTLALGTGTLSSGGAITTSGNISTTGSGTITSAGGVTSAGNIVTTGSGTITSAGAITAGSDISTTGNIYTSGNIYTTGTGAMTSNTTVQAAQGSAALPTFTFASQTSSGLYYNAAAGGTAIASGGADRLVTYRQKTGLTNGSANPLVTVGGLATNPRAALRLEFLIEAADATNSQALAGIVMFAAQQTSGTVTATSSAFDSVAVGSGTLSAVWSVTTSTAGQATLNVTPTSSLTTTTLRVSFALTSVNAAANTITYS